MRGDHSQAIDIQALFKANIPLYPAAPAPDVQLFYKQLDSGPQTPSVSAGINQKYPKIKTENVMKQEKNNKDRLVAFRVSKTEYEKLVKFQKATTCHKLSEYIRNIVLRNPVYVKTRNLSLDAFVLEIVALRNQFKAVGFNFNQVVHKLHTLQEIPEFKVWLLVNEKHKGQLFAKIKELQDRMNQVYELWKNELGRPIDQ